MADLYAEPGRLEVSHPLLCSYTFHGFWETFEGLFILLLLFFLSFGLHKVLFISKFAYFLFCNSVMPV